MKDQEESINDFLDIFCKKEDSTRIWDGNDFGTCFEKVVLISPVYLIMSCICSYYIVKASCSPIVSGNLNRIWVLYLRLLIHLAIISAEISLFIQQFLSADNIETVEIVSQSLILLAWCLSALVIFIWRRGWHCVNSGRDFDILIASWCFVFLSCSFELHSAILSSTGQSSALDSDTFKDYELRNIYTRWSLSVCLLLSQLIRSNVPENASEEEGETSERTVVQQPPTENSFSLISRTSFHWVTRLFTLARQTQYPTVEDLPFGLPNSLNPAGNHCSFQLALTHYTQQSTNLSDDMQPLLEEAVSEENLVSDKYFLVKSINRAFGWTFWPLNLIKLLEVILNVSVPVILNLFLRELERNVPNLLSASLYLVLLVVVSIIRAFVSSHLRFELRKLGMRLKGALISELFSKVLSVNFAKLKSFSVGQISNFATEDANAISSNLNALMNLWAIPVELSIIMVLLYHYVTVSFLSALVFCILVTPLNLYIMSQFETHEEKLMAKRDSRLKMLHEIFGNMKTVKFFSWEGSLMEKLLQLRDFELSELKSIAVLDAISVFGWTAAPITITGLTIGTYSFMGKEITVSILFTVLALVSLMIEPLNMIPWVFLDFVLAKVSLQRVQKFFCLPKSSPSEQDIEAPLGENSIIEMDNCSFFWSDKEDCCLVNLQFQVNKGDLMVVMGKTGSGKSSLLLALSQELNLASGALRLKEWKDGAGIVLQDCWVKAGTVRETIVDGCVFDLFWYETVVSACALDKDIANFPMGDETPVGVNGSALSGGQRLRLSLARAVYKNKQVYLIDDIFSGLDSQVVHHIVENCINGVLANKTRVICTHNKSLSSYANSLMILEEGRIQYIGPPNISSVSQINDSKVISESKESETDKTEKSEKPSEPYVEPRRFGAVQSSVYKFYLKSAGFVLTFFVILSLFGMQATDSASSIWLSYWAKSMSVAPGISTIRSHSNLNFSSFVDSKGYRGSNDEVFSVPTNSTFYLEVYGAIIAGNIFISIGRVLSFIPFQITATKILHEKMLSSIMKAPLHLFDATPLGVIINRFSSDVYTVDSDVPIDVNILLSTLCELIGVVVVTCYGLPYILISFIPLAILYYFIQKYYRCAAREVKRLYSVSQSPLFSHFEETLAGVSYIHSFRSNSLVQNTGMKILKAYQRADYCLGAANAWLSLRLELITCLVIVLASSIILIELSLGDVDASRLALGLTFALSISEAMDSVISSYATVEKSFVSAERVMQFTENLPIETDVEDPITVNNRWPDRGSISFTSVSVRYQNCSSKALDNISFSARAGEKVAIVGRTGAGKSTVLLALFKLVDLEGGNITIGDVDISEIDNQVLRKSLTVIPQQPLVFSGTLRDNMDPFQEHEDEDIEAALRQTQLGEFLDSKGGLDCEVSLGTLSTGESQLISLARALLKQSKVVCLDEATSNVDIETDHVIQDLLREQFKLSTVLTVAHRIDTVLHYDRVVVMSQGTIVEEGKPKELLEDTSSHFYKLAQSSGVCNISSPTADLEQFSK